MESPVSQFEKDLTAVKEAGSALEFVKSQTPEICMVAMNTNPFALKNVKEQTTAICLLSSLKNSWSLVYIANPVLQNSLKKLTN